MVRAPPRLNTPRLPTLNRQSCEHLLGLVGELKERGGNSAGSEPAHSRWSLSTSTGILSNFLSLIRIERRAPGDIPPLFSHRFLPEMSVLPQLAARLSKSHPTSRKFRRLVCVLLILVFEFLHFKIFLTKHLYMKIYTSQKISQIMVLHWKNCLPSML